MLSKLRLRAASAYPEVSRYEVDPTIEEDVRGSVRQI